MDLGVGGRGGARRRTRRRANARASAMQQSQPAQPAAQPGTSVAGMLDMLKQLHAAGILTDEEYNAKKLLVVEKIG